MLPPATALCRKRRRPNCRSRNGPHVPINPKILSITTPIRSAEFFHFTGRKYLKNSRRRYGNDSSESGHTQYAFPKKGNALLDIFTFQENFIKM